MKLSEISSTGKLRRYMPQIIAVIIKNSVLFVYGISIGLPTILIPNLSGSDPNESIVLDEEGISWIGKCIYVFHFDLPQVNISNKFIKFLKFLLW